MISKIRNMLVVFAAAVALAAPALVVAPVLAQDTAGGLCGGINLEPDDDQIESCTIDESSETNFRDILKNIINIFSIVVGVIAVIMIIVGGLKYITSGGDSSNVSGAKNTIIYALVGLVIVALAQFIVRFVLAQSASVGTDGAPIGG